ncbi:TatD family hydrolase [Methanolapillus millepedarum]|uniref:Metal-dependent hydrolase n=1 Tax=Methanolapillus millepedarum TaxID=3028296 RepID=A0AA96V2G3_9EURY|nr:hypothetical protein MsAc7_08450 [Methanosarcinaceae archaeon Ac7]
MKSSLPITDNHIHIDLLRGRGLSAVSEFKNAGGTHMFLVTLPSWYLGVSVQEKSDYISVFEETIRTAEIIQKETGIIAFPVLGIHPVEIMHLSEEIGLKNAVDVMCGGFDIAARYVSEKAAVAIKSGRPHYPVSAEIREASNQVMCHAFEVARDLKCTVQLHVEDMTAESLKSISALAKSVGISPEKVVNHHATPLVADAEKFGIYPSVTAGKDFIEKALEQGSRFLMETDYVDDPQRPGFVLGPKTVPKKTKKLIEIYGEEPFWKIHQENPSRIYDVEIE